MINKDIQKPLWLWQLNLPRFVFAENAQALPSPQCRSDLRGMAQPSWELPWARHLHSKQGTNEPVRVRLRAAVPSWSRTCPCPHCPWGQSSCVCEISFWIKSGQTSCCRCISHGLQHRAGMQRSGQTRRTLPSKSYQKEGSEPLGAPTTPWSTSYIMERDKRCTSFHVCWQPTALKWFWLFCLSLSTSLLVQKSLSSVPASTFCCHSLPPC